MIELAEEHGLTPALWCATSTRGIPLPTEVHEVLRTHYLSNRGRSMLLRQQLSDVTRQLRDAGVASILLKGAAYLAAGLFHDAAIREMADLDVLIDPANLPAAAAALESLGYRRQDRPFGIEQHDVLFISSTGVAPVELHRAIGVPAVAQLLTWDRIWRRSEAIEVGGSPTHILGPQTR